MSGGGEKTEKATPKRRAEARRKGQVAKSMDANGAVVLLASLLALAILGPGIAEAMADAIAEGLTRASNPGMVTQRGVDALLGDALLDAGKAIAPIALVCLVVGMVVSVAQVGFKPSPEAMKPDPKKLNPLSGFKRVFGLHFIFESGKTVVKVGVVAAIAAWALFPELEGLAALVGLPPEALLPELAQMVLGIAQRAGLAYLVIAAADMAWQRFQHEKQMKMDKDEVKREGKDQQVSSEVRAAIRRRQMQAAGTRMMEDVPTADVVVTNPTHYAVALRYDGTKPSPEVVAKGQDLIALRIRAVAKEHGVPVIEDPPLARSLHSSIEVGGLVPEELFQAVAALLAFVYRTARRRVPA